MEKSSGHHSIVNINLHCIAPFILKIRCVPNAPQDLSDQFKRVVLCIFGSSANKLLVDMVLRASLGQSFEHMGR